MWLLLCFLNALGRKLSQLHFGLIDFHVTESQTVLNVSKGETKPTRADAHVNRVPEGKAKSLPTHGKESMSWVNGIVTDIYLELLKGPHISLYDCLSYSLLPFLLNIYFLCILIHLFTQQTVPSSVSYYGGYKGKWPSVIVNTWRL